MTESILQIKDLKKSFGDNEILKGISLDVKQGEVVVILGSSGCGKSTLLRCINGLETIQGGDILLDGKSITGSKKDFHLIRQKIGMVFQSYDLFPHLDILQNLILGPVKAQGRNPAGIPPSRASPANKSKSEGWSCYYVYPSS